MKNRIKNTIITMIICAVAFSIMPTKTHATETFTLAWSEYPSWSILEVASVFKLIDGKKGKLGPIEQKWNVDIELKLMDYDACMTAYAAFQVDAVCITNMDVLNPSISRPSVAIMPTSTSFGADALIVDSSITSVDQLKKVNVYGLAKSVSEYCFARNLQILGLNPSDFTFTNLDPSAAATLFQQHNAGYHAIIVWNPFVLSTLNMRKNDSRVLFSSTSIPNEIIDMVVVSESSLKKAKGDNFANALIDTYYQINERLANPTTHDETLIAIGQKFSNLGLQDMRKVVEQTRFFGTAKDGIAIFQDPKMVETMNNIVKFCVDNNIVTEKPVISFEKTNNKTNLRFDASYMQNYKK